MKTVTTHDNIGLQLQRWENPKKNCNTSSMLIYASSLRHADRWHGSVDRPTIPRPAVQSRTLLVFSLHHFFFGKSNSASTDVTIAPSNHAHVHLKSPPAECYMLQVSLLTLHSFLSFLRSFFTAYLPKYDTSWLMYKNIQHVRLRFIRWRCYDVEQ